MLKKFKSTDIDVLMNIWKKGYMDTRNKFEDKNLTQIYNEVRNLLLDNTSDTTLYTEDDVIEGFITVDKDKKIMLIYVEKKIRREGIGSMLVESCKKRYDKLYAIVKANEINKNFFEKNDFELKENNYDSCTTYEWENCQERKVNLVYFDDDLDEGMLLNQSLNVKRVDVKDILREDKELKSIRNYMKVRKNIERAFDKKVLLYLNYGNYNEVLYDIIKEITKIEKSELSIVISEPLVIENQKMEVHLKKIEKSFKDYKIYKIEIMKNIKENISVNKVLEEKMKIISDQIKKIAENI